MPFSLLVQGFWRFGIGDFFGIGDLGFGSSLCSCPHCRPLLSSNLRDLHSRRLICAFALAPEQFRTRRKLPLALCASAFPRSRLISIHCWARLLWSQLANDSLPGKTDQDQPSRQPQPALSHRTTRTVPSRHFSTNTVRFSGSGQQGSIPGVLAASSLPPTTECARSSGNNRSIPFLYSKAC